MSGYLISTHIRSENLCLLCRRPSGKGAAYIKISESEIANDYPEPAPYQKVILHYQPCCNCVAALLVDEIKHKAHCFPDGH